MNSLCIKCKGKGLCKKRCTFLKNSFFTEKENMHLRTITSPEIFVGKANYPNVSFGIISPRENDKIASYPDAESWIKNNFSIENILRIRNKLIYSNSITNVKKENQIKRTIQELAMASRPTSTEIFLKRKPIKKTKIDSISNPIMNQAPIEKATIDENIKINPKVDYIVSDTEAKSSDAINELYKSKIPLFNIQRLLSAGLLGNKNSRKMVPTRWSITATDDIISKKQIEEIKYFNEIDKIMLFKSEYLGNTILSILIPGKFSFEVVESWIDKEGKITILNDYEDFNGRKEYAKNITGGYYAMRIALTEYLIKIKKQAKTIMIREISPKYYAPLGVGIVRETSRKAFEERGEELESLDLVFERLKNLIKTDINKIKEISWTIKNNKYQKTINQFIPKHF